MPAPIPAPGRVLIAEDDDSLRRLLELRLAAERFDIRAGADGIEAMEIIESWTPDVVICDVMMPRMSGFSVCRELRERDDTATVPIVLLTARCFDEDIQQLLTLGGIEYLGKPFDFAHLIKTVRTMLGAVDNGTPRTVSLAAGGARG